MTKIARIARAGPARPASGFRGVRIDSLARQAAGRAPAAEADASPDAIAGDAARYLAAHGGIHRRSLTRLLLD